MAVVGPRLGLITIDSLAGDRKESNLDKYFADLRHDNLVRILPQARSRLPVGHDLVSCRLAGSEYNRKYRQISLLIDPITALASVREAVDPATL